MMRPCRYLLMLAAMLSGSLASTLPASAERLIAFLSFHRVQVTSNFTGTQIVLFGSIERDTPAAVLRRNYDIVVTVSGPRQTVVTRRKGRVFGIWANADSRMFVNVPNYLAVLTSRAIETIAKPDVARRLQIGPGNIVLSQQIGPDIVDTVRDDPFRANFIRLKVDQKLYSEMTNGVTFLSPTLFRADIALPAVAPFGNYDVDVKLFSDGAIIAHMTSAFELVKLGLAQFLADAAHNHGVLYGLTTVLMAFGTGWFASVVFRRD